METTKSTAVHPSRTARTCAQCAHKRLARQPYQAADIPMCNHPSTPVDEITRAPTITCQEARTSFCGKEAVMFEPSDLSYSDEFRGKKTIRLKQEVGGVVSYKTVLADTVSATTSADAPAHP
jgi:hypothetical protein